MVDQINEDYLKELLTNVKELVRWSKFSGKKQLKEIITQNLKSDNELLIYEFSDGERSTREISKIVGKVSHSTVATYWNKWNKLGIVETSQKYEGRFQRLCSLEEIGLSIPDSLKVADNHKTDEKELVE